MLCPECGAQAADEAAFCPKCDNILDPSLFMDELPPPTPHEDTNPGIPLQQPPPPPKARGKTASAKTASPAPKRTPSARTAASPPDTSDALDDVGDVDDGLPAPPEAGPPRWSSERGEKSEFNEAEMLLGSLKADFLAQSGADKLMVVGALGMVLSCFFPWKHLSRTGDILGFLSLGALMVPLAIASVGAMVWRKRSDEAFPLLPWLLQGLSGLVGIVFCLVLIKVFWLSRAQAELLHIESSTPAVGLFIGLLFAILNLTGTAMGFKRGY